MSVQVDELGDRRNRKAEVEALSTRVQELERLVDILSRGKYLWESTFDAIQDPVSLIDRQYRIQRANLSMAKRSGVDIRKMIGKHCYEVFAKRSDPCPGCPAAETMRRDWQATNHLEQPIRDREYAVQAFPFPSAKGSDHAVVMHYRDVTEEHRLQQELVQQEKMAAIGVLAGGVAHEINNPLGGILAFTQLLMRDFKETENVHADLVEIERAALRCKKIVADLLDFSRLSSGKEMAPLELGPLFEQVFGFLKRELLSHNIDLSCEIDPKTPLVKANGNRLQQIFLNFLTNASHAMPKGGKITVRVYPDAETRMAVISIADTGLGIPKEHLSKIFNPFFTTKEPGQGTGLGLSVSYRIVREHEGSIQVKSEEGKGTQFWIRLPEAVAGVA